MHYPVGVCRMFPVPCFPGHFVKYTTGSMGSSKCQACPDDFYQDRFGMSTCYSCPGIDDELNPNVTFSKSFCIGQCFRTSSTTSTHRESKYVGPPYSPTKIYAARMSYAADVARGSSKAAGRRQMSIDICSTRRSTAANPPHVAAAIDRRDRQTDGQINVM